MNNRSTCSSRVRTPCRNSLIGFLIVCTFGLAGCGTETISPAYNNTPPEILSLTAEPGDSLEIQDSISLFCEAIDADNQPLRYLWSATFGSLTTDTSTTTWWKAPRTVGNYWISVKVSDPFTNTIASHQVFVLPRGATNRSPQIAHISVDPDTVTPGDAVNAAVQATDAEGDALSYIWTAPGGFFFPESGPQVRWFAPPETGEYFLKVTVIDAHHMVTDSLSVLVAPDTTIEYLADFSTDQVTGAWGSMGLLAGLGTDEGINQISWDSTNQAMSAIARPNYGTYAFRLVGRSFGAGTFTCTVKVTNGEFQRIGFVPKLIDRMNYLLIAINPYGGSWQVLRCTAGSIQYLAEGWKIYDLLDPIRFSYVEADSHATAMVNGEQLWSGVVTSQFRRSVQMGVALHGTSFSEPALFDNFRVSVP